MARKVSLALLLAGLTMLGLGSTVCVGGDKEEKKEGKKSEEKKFVEATAEVKAVRKLNLAGELAVYGRENKSVEALVLAARIIGTTDTQKGKAEDIKAKEQFEYDELKEANELLAEAAKLAQSDAAKAMIAEAKTEIAERKRGASGGPKRFSGRMSPGDPADTYTVVFVGGQTAEVSVRSQPSYCDVDLEIIDEATFQVVARDRHSSPNAFVRFTPPRTQRYIIRVVNYRQQVSCTYTITTN